MPASPTGGFPGRDREHLAPSRRAGTAVRAGLALVSALALASPLVPRAARAQEGTEPSAHEDDPEELREALFQGERSGAVHAAIELFSWGKPHYDGRHDTLLKEVLAPRPAGGSAASRRYLLEALGIVGRDRPRVACSLARLAIADPDPSVREEARQALVAVERPEAYRFLEEALVQLAHAAEGSPQEQDLVALVDVLERKRDPIAATGVLVEALRAFDGPIERPIYAALKRLTGRSFATEAEWLAWYDRHKNVPQREWYLEVIRGLEDSSDRAQTSAEKTFERLLAVLSKDETALLRELEDSLGRETLPAVRAVAIRYLGTLGARPGTQGDRALALLEGLVRPGPQAPGERTPPGPGRDADEATTAAALQALGHTERTSELPLILGFLDHPARSVRIAAIVALGNLRAEAATTALEAPLEAAPAIESRDPELAGVLARSLGVLGKDPGGRISAVLLRFVDRVLATNGPAGPATAGGSVASARPLLLQAGAEALGKLGPALEPETERAAAVVDALARLSAASQDQDVRWWATTSLGLVPHRSALSVLSQRLKDDTLNVRKAAAGAIGVQARRKGASEELVRESMGLLALELAGPDDSLRRAARTELELVVGQDPSTFVALEALVEALRKRGEPDLAAPFLDGLPAPDKLGDSQKAHLQRYWSLLEARADARLRLEDGRGAALDYDALLTGLGPLLPSRSRALTLAKARALLAAGDGRAAGELAARLARSDPKDAEAWALLGKCAEGLLGRGERAPVKELFASVEKALADAPAELQATLQDALKRSDAPPEAPHAPAPSPRATPAGAGGGP